MDDLVVGGGGADEGAVGGEEGGEVGGEEGVAARGAPVGGVEEGGLDVD